MANDGMTLRGRTRPFENSFRRTSGVHEDGPPRAYKAAARAFEIAAERVKEAEELAAQGKLTNAGIREQLQESHDEWEAKLEPIREVLEVEVKGFQRLREKTADPTTPLEPADAVGASRRAEIRAALRSASDEERMAILARATTGDGDDEILQAVADAPGWLSGVVTERYRELAVNKLREKRFPDEIERMENYARNAERLRGAVRRAESIMREIAGLDFDRSTIDVPEYVPGAIARDHETAAA